MLSPSGGDLVERRLEGVRVLCNERKGEIGGVESGPERAKSQHQQEKRRPDTGNRQPHPCVQSAPESYHGQHALQHGHRQSQSDRDMPQIHHYIEGVSPCVEGYGLLHGKTNHKPENPHKRMDEGPACARPPPEGELRKRLSRGCKSRHRQGKRRPDIGNDNRECSPLQTPVRGNTLCSMATAKARATAIYPNSPLCLRSVSVCPRIRLTALQDKPQTGKSSQADGRKLACARPPHEGELRKRLSRGCKSRHRQGKRRPDTGNRQPRVQSTPDACQGQHALQHGHRQSQSDRDIPQFTAMSKERLRMSEDTAYCTTRQTTNRKILASGWTKACLCTSAS